MNNKKGGGADLWNSDPAASFDKVLYVAPALGDGEFRDGRRRYVDGGDGARAHVVGQVAQDDSVRQCGCNVIR